MTKTEKMHPLFHVTWLSNLPFHSLQNTRDAEGTDVMWVFSSSNFGNHFEFVTG